MEEEYEYEGCHDLSKQETQHKNLFYQELKRRMCVKNDSQSFFFKEKYDKIVSVCIQARTRPVSEIRKEGFSKRMLGSKSTKL